MHSKKKEKGAVSVFLTLVLIPVMILSLLTTDAAKIYSAKVVISDAGEMSMNAALAQYEEKMFDQYGLLAMQKTPEAMQGDLEDFFIKTLNSEGVTGVSSYEEMLGLLEESFEAIGVSNTEVYRTEVEKQQILEYMKYRAPVCLTELVLEKLNLIKDTKKICEAMNKQIEFAQAMEDCNDAFEEALAELNKLNNMIQNFPTPNDMDAELAYTEHDLTETVAKCLLMREAIQVYTKKPPADKTVEEMMKSYILAADSVDLRDPYSETSYESYLSAMYYFNGISASGGADSLNKSSEAPDKEEDPEGYAQWQANSQANSQLISDYKHAKDRISGYMTTLLGLANSYVTNHHDALNGFHTKATEAAAQADKAWNALEYVREKLLQASNAYNAWDNAESKLSKEVAGGMEAELERYRDFFDGEDLQALGLLQTNINTDKQYFREVKSVLEEETLFDVKITTTSASSQMSQYSSKAKTVVSGQDPSFMQLEAVRHESFESHYGHTKIETSVTLVRIYDDPFYLRLQEYCKEQDINDSDTEAEKVNQNLDDGAEGAEEAKDDSKYPSFDWSTATSQTLPSVALGLASYSQASSTLTDLGSGSNVKKKSSRKGIISKMKDSINAAESFLDGVDRIISNNIENLYVAEYAMQMFSHYTCDKKMQSNKELRELTESENISLSGYKLPSNKAYKSEIEYILWGNKQAKTNIQSTVMMLFGVRLLFNSIHAFTDKDINFAITEAATAIAGGAPYLIPIIKIAIKFGLAAAETGKDVSRLKEGYGVVILKDTTTFESWVSLDAWVGPDVRGSAENATTFDYGEYLRLFLNVHMLAGNENKVLARIGDCIQVNTDTDMTKDFTMIEVQSDVKVKTTFMRKISDWASAGWKYDDSYTVNYKSVLSY